VIKSPNYLTRCIASVLITITVTNPLTAIPLRPRAPQPDASMVQERRLFTQQALSGRLIFERLPTAETLGALKKRLFASRRSPARQTETRHKMARRTFFAVLGLGATAVPAFPQTPGGTPSGLLSAPEGADPTATLRRLARVEENKGDYLSYAGIDASSVLAEINRIAPADRARIIRDAMRRWYPKNFVVRLRYDALTDERFLLKTILDLTHPEPGAEGVPVPLGQRADADALLRRAHKASDARLKVIYRDSGGLRQDAPIQLDVQMIEQAIGNRQPVLSVDQAAAVIASNPKIFLALLLFSDAEGTSEVGQATREKTPATRSIHAAPDEALRAAGIDLVELNRALKPFHVAEISKASLLSSKPSPLLQHFQAERQSFEAKMPHYFFWLGFGWVEHENRRPANRLWTISQPITAGELKERTLISWDDSANLFLPGVFHKN